jgi:AcrR family transcriptional regulator
MNFDSLIQIIAQKCESQFIMVVKQTRKEIELEQRKEYILNRASELFCEFGYENTSVAMIAEKSEFSVGTVYNLFPSKNDIYSELICRDVKKIRDRNAEIAKSDIDPLKKIYNLIEVNLSGFVEHFSCIKMIVDDMTHFEWGMPHNFGKKEINLFKDLATIDGAIFTEARDKGFLRLDIDILDMVHIQRRIMTAYMMVKIQKQEELDIKKTSDEIFDVMMNGLGKKK